MRVLAETDIRLLLPRDLQEGKGLALSLQPSFSLSGADTAQTFLTPFHDAQIPIQKTVLSSG